jgi:hypothetical protein
MLRSRRIESTSPEFAVSVVARDQESGNAIRLEYGADRQLLRHAIASRFPREQWLGDVIGEEVWYDEQGEEVRREPVLLGRAPLGSS